MKIQIPNSFMGVNGEEALERILKKEPRVPQPTPITAPAPSRDVPNSEKYIILEARTHGNYSYPELLVSMERTHQNNGWYETHEILAQEGAFMPTIRQFVDFLNLLKSGKAFDGRGKSIDKRKLDSVLDDILTVRDPWRSEWLDADFKVLDKKLKVFGGKVVMNYEHRIVNGNLSASRKDEVMEGYLAQDKKPGIDVNDWLSRATYQGLPPQDVGEGKLWYWQPGKDNNSVAGFYAYSGRAGLFCYWDPSLRNSNLGVRAVRKKI